RDRADDRIRGRARGLRRDSARWGRVGDAVVELAARRGTTARSQDVPGGERRVLPGGPARLVAPVPHQPRAEHRGELRARADLPARRPETRAGDAPAASAWAGPLKGASRLGMSCSQTSDTRGW